MKKTKSDEKPIKGQPTKYKAEHAELAYRFCLLGAIDAQLAEMFEVKESTINNWKKRHPEFTKSIRMGKIIADAEVANSLYKQATGYTRKIRKVFAVMGEPQIIEIEEYFPPNVTASKFWLINRDKKHWRDKQDVEHSGEVGLAAFFESLNGKANKLPDRG